MTKSERIIRSIIGAERTNIRALAVAVDITADVLFIQGVPMDEIAVSKDIYPVVANRIGKTIPPTVRQIERTANLCIDALDDPLMEQYIGRPLAFRPPPRALIIYLALYLHFGEPFFKVIERDPVLLF